MRRRKEKTQHPNHSDREGRGSYREAEIELNIGVDERLRRKPQS